MIGSVCARNIENPMDYIFDYNNTKKPIMKVPEIFRVGNQNVRIILPELRWCGHPHLHDSDNKSSKR